MSNPWEEINLSDYENHMKLDSVKQLQSMNETMKQQLSDYDVHTVMILGIAGGNGLEHIGDKYHKSTMVSVPWCLTPWFYRQKAGGKPGQ